MCWGREDLNPFSFQPTSQVSSRVYVEKPGGIRVWFAAFVDISQGLVVYNAYWLPVYFLY